MPLSSVDQNFLKMAQHLGAKDPRAIESKSAETGGGLTGNLKRGAVIAHGNRIVATGVSMHLGGALYKPEHQSERHIATVSAELVAISEAIKQKNDLNQVSIYISAPPTWPSFKVLVTLGIKRIVCFGPSENKRIQHYATELGIELLIVG
jgi:deoxycytidylate deaminase